MIQTCLAPWHMPLPQYEANGAAIQTPAELGDVRLELAKLSQHLPSSSFLSLICLPLLLRLD